MKKRHLKILASVVIALGAVVFIATQSLGDVEYYAYVDQFHDNPQKYLDKRVVKLHGNVVPGSIEEEIVDQKTRRTFRLERKGREIEVRHAGSKPDTFKDQAETVAKGRVVKEGDRYVLLAVEGEAGIMAKCPSKYDGSR